MLRSSAEARAAGVHAATAPIVVFTEDHSLPEPAWAESLIRAHGEAWAVVGPAVINANPRHAVSWANLLIEYIEWLHPAPRAGLAPAGAQQRLPDVLLHYGADCGEWLEVESLLHWDLAANGQSALAGAGGAHPPSQLLTPAGVDPAAVLERKALCCQAQPGLVALPASALHPAGAADPRRASCAHPAPPAASRAASRPFVVLPLTAFLLACSTAGEAAGYALGAGAAPETLVDLDFRREQFMSAADRRDLSAGAAVADGSERLEPFRTDLLGHHPHLSHHQASLADCLEALARTRHREEYEAIVVDDGGSTALEGTVAPFPGTDGRAAVAAGER